MVLGDKPVNGGGDRNGAEVQRREISSAFWNEVQIRVPKRLWGRRGVRDDVQKKREIQFFQKGEGGAIEKERDTIRTIFFM